MASYPGAVKIFATRANGQTIDASHVNDLQDEVNAIEAGLLNGTANLQSSNTTVVNLSVLGNTTIAGSLDAVGNSTFHNNLHVVANCQFDANSTISGSLDVTGNSTFHNNLHVAANAQFDAASTFGGSVGIGGSLIIAGTTSITLSTGNTNNLVVGADVFLLRLAANSSGSSLTGIQTAAGNQRLLFVSNVSANNLVLVHASAGSASSNQMQLPGGGNLTLNAVDGVLMIYDSTSAVWRTAMS